jgi:uncharacterized protein YdeI (YjbR/CyaY-like superfamily)
MGTRDARVDAYIDAAGEFAKPILKHLRKIVHRACPEVEETLKWRMPTFMYHGMLCGMAAFKQHCAFGFWKQELVVGKERAGNSEAMGQFGSIKTRSDLPADDLLVGYIEKAMRLNEAGVKAPRSIRKHKPLTIPAELSAALAKNKRAQKAFEVLSPSHRREYAEWIAEAKREETRSRRVSQAIEWIAAGKPRNWKYMNC